MERPSPLSIKLYKKRRDEKKLHDGSSVLHGGEEERLAILNSCVQRA